jgi:hypothetical protein
MKTADPRELLDDTFSYREAREAGMSDARIYGLRDARAILALGGGVYRWADAPLADFDLIEIAERVSRATLCLETALARHELIDSIPSAIDVAIPRGKTRPALKAPCRLHQFDPQTFDLGRETLDVDARTPLGIYSAERSLAESAISKAATSHGRHCAGGCANQAPAPHSSSRSPSTSPARSRQSARRWKSCCECSDSGQHRRSGLPRPAQARPREPSPRR